MTKRILIAYSKASQFVPTTAEYLAALKAFTHYRVDYAHVTHGARLSVDLNDYDVVFNNYCARLCFDGYVSEHYQNALLNFRGLKIISVQDDYDHIATLHRAIRRLGFHVALTPMPRESWPLVYPQSEIPGVSLMQVLTGYVSQRRLPVIPLAQRKTHVAYRGRDTGTRYGRLGFEKAEIGRRMKEICTARNIPHDIAIDDHSRIYGDAWFEFLGSARVVLGSESGSNVFDFDGVLYDLDGIVNVGQISPRIFEAALAKTPMILFEGKYSGAIEAGVHYIALERDFSNADAILSRLDDLDWLQGFADRAYERLILSERYSYTTFAELIEQTIEREYAARINPESISMRKVMAKQPMPARRARPRMKMLQRILGARRQIKLLGLRIFVRVYVPYYIDKIRKLMVIPYLERRKVVRQQRELNRLESEWLDQWEWESHQ